MFSGATTQLTAPREPFAADFRRNPPLAFAFSGPDASPMEMTEARWHYTCDYLVDTFGAQDAHLAGLMDEATKAGLPPIAVSADVGRFLQLLTSMTRGRLAIEVGTLAGYSAIWLARGLASDGRLITIENEPMHAEFARGQLNQAGLAEKTEVREGAALQILKSLHDELAPGTVDVLFLDADKREYPAYFAQAKELIAPGGLLIADNALGSSEWWIDTEDNAYRAGAHALNAELAQDPNFEAVALPIREGVLVARRTLSTTP